jgi:arsenate reductase
MTINVLFLCPGNSTLSIFAEVILARLGRGVFKAYSAGNEPAAGIDALTLYELERNNYSAEGLAVDDWNDFARPDAPALDFVIALSRHVPLDDAPAWRGDPLVTVWPVADPAEVDGEDLQRKAAFVRALTEIESRISIFVNLPIAALDRLKLQQQLNAIGADR